MRNLTTTPINTIFNTSTQPYNSGAAPFVLNVPSSYVSVVEPHSYEFRVAEHLDENGNVVKVGLQVQIWTHDAYGMAKCFQTWQDVERVQIPHKVAKEPNA